jgi:hypothetical protein
MQGQLAERHRLWMRSPTQPVFRKTIQQFAGRNQFVFDLFKERIR